MNLNAPCNWQLELASYEPDYNMVELSCVGSHIIELTSQLAEIGGDGKCYSLAC